VFKSSKASSRTIFGWGMFDFANQAFTLLIITVIFGDLYTRVIVADGPDYRLGNLLWSLALALSYLMVVLFAPLLGALADYTARRKRFLFISYLLTVAASFALVVIEPGIIGLGFVLIVLANAAYAFGESFIAAFLPSLGTPGEMGRISGFGWALGYGGGLVAAGFALLFLGEVSVENYDRIRWVGPFAALFFLVAAIPTFLWVPEPPGRARALKRRLIGAAFARVRGTVQFVGYYRDLAWLFGSLLFAMAGVYVVIAFSFIYGAQVIGWSEQTRTLMFVAVQVSALLGALLFGRLQDCFGGKRTFALTLLLWVVAIGAIVFVVPITGWVNAALGSGYESEDLFLIAGVLAGLSLGSSQSIGRALVGVFTPERKAAELFGFWGLFCKLAAIFGLFGVGLLQWLFGLQGALIFCAVLFVVALLVLIPIDEARGRLAATA
jgi:UMF1 family MFS transporter